MTSYRLRVGNRDGSGRVRKNGQSVYLWLGCDASVTESLCLHVKQIFINFANLQSFL